MEVLLRRQGIILGIEGDTQNEQNRSRIGRLGKEILRKREKIVLALTKGEDQDVT